MKPKKVSCYFYMPVNMETGDIGTESAGELIYPEDEEFLKDEYYKLQEGWEWRPIKVTFKGVKKSDKK